MKEAGDSPRVIPHSEGSEDTFRLLFEKHPAPMWVYDPKTLAFLDVNHAAVDKYGYTREDFLSMTLTDIRPPEDVPRLIDDIAVLRPDLQHSSAWRHKLRNGSIIDVDITSHTLLYQGHKAVLVIVHDITERRHTEDGLLQSEIRYHRLFDNMLEGFAFCRMVFTNDNPVDFEYLEVNNAFATILGLTNVVGKRVTEVISGIKETNPQLFEIYGRVARTGKPERFEVYVGPLDKWFSVSAYSTRPGYFASVFNDITQRKRTEDDLRESERRFREMLETVNLIALTLDTNGIVTFCNDYLLRLTGWRHEEVIGTDWFERFIPKEDIHVKSIFLESLVTSSIPVHHENDVLTKAGALRSIRWNNTVLRNAAGMVVGTASIGEDITDRKLAEEAANRLAAIVQSSEEAVIGKSLDGIITSWNKGAETIYGYSEAEVLGKSISILAPPERADEILEILEKIKNGEHVHHFETLRRKKDGTHLFMSLTVSPIYSAEKRIVGASVIGRDVTERKLIEERIRHSEEQFRLIAENVADLIAVLDMDGRRVYLSPSYRSVLGDPEQLKGTDGFRDIHPDDRERVRQAFRKAAKTGAGQRIEYRLKDREGNVRNIEAKASLIRDGNGEISQVVVVSRDVTEERRLAAQFLRAQRMESIGTLAAGIAHDLNNVLSPILMAIEVLRHKVSDPRGQELLTTIETSAKRGSDIIRQVLAFGRGVGGDRVLVQLRHIIKEVVAIAAETFPKSIKIETDIPRELWTVSADPTQMQQVLMNVMVNARDAMPDGGTLVISAENVTLDGKYARLHVEAKPGEYVTLAITDTGTGIPASIRNRVFEPFFTTKKLGSGTGLGLSTTLGIIKSHDGFINLYSEEGEGTTVRIYIPATSAAPGVPQESVNAVVPLGHGEVILIIDDEEAIREIMKETLQSYGYEALLAKNGAEGVVIFTDNRQSIRAVIIDMMMPVMDGTATITALHEIDPDVKIIATSGLVTKGRVTAPQDSIVKAFLTKPHTAEKLLRALAAVLTRNEIRR